MFGRRVRERSGKSARRGRRLHLEQLEDRCVPHTGVTLFADGLTAAAQPAGIVSGPDGNFWFTEFAADRVARITPTGTITEFAVPGAGSGPLNIVVGPDGALWFTQNGSDQIGRITTDGAITEYTVPGAGSKPNDIAVGPDGALWFTETGSDQIGRVTTAGTVTEYTVPGVGSAPAGIAAGPDGALWFTQAGSGQIGRVTTAGVFTEYTIPVAANGVSDPEDIVAGPGGHLYFTDFGRDQIGRITTDGAVTQFNLPVGRGPQSIVAFDDGDLYFTEAASSRIGRLPASALAQGAPGFGSPPLEEFDFIPRDSVPLGIAISPTGDIWFTLNNGNAVGNFLAHLQQLTATATGPTVQVYDVKLQPVRTFEPFAGYQGELSLAVADTNRNGIPDVIVGVASPGGAPAVKVFDGSDNRLLSSFFAFDPGYLGGITVTAEDVNGDGFADIIVAAGVGGRSHIKVIDGTKMGQVLANGQIADSALLASFLAFGNFDGTLSLGAGDIDRDGLADIIVGASGSSHVKVINAAKLSQVLPAGQIADAALLASFFAFAPAYAGGTTVAFSKNVDRRDVIVGAAAGTSHVKVIDGTKLTQVMPTGQIADAALLASFLAFAPGFVGGVSVGADDLNFDGRTEVIVGAGPGGGSRVAVVDGTKLTQVMPTGQIADAALRASFLAAPGFNGGVPLASDADHRDGTIFGPPGVTVSNSRRDINDAYIFQSPTNPDNTVLILTVSPFSTGTTPNSFEPGVLYDFRIANRDLLNTTDDLTFRATFGPADANGVQDVALRALPAALFAGSGGVIVKGFTNQNVAVRGVGGSGAMFRAAEQDDPFFFDAAGFNALLNNTTAVQGVVDGDFPRGTGTFGPGGTPNYDAPNFFAGANTLAIALEVPSAVLTQPGSNVIGLWARTEAGGVQQDRVGRPGINTALIPPVPRGAGFPIGGTADANRQDLRNAFNAGHPRDDRANFTAAMVSTLTAFYPAGRPGGSPNAGQAAALAGFLLPDILAFDTTSTNGFAGGIVTDAMGNNFLGNGRKLSDDVISIELSVLTDDDLPAMIGTTPIGGPNQPALVTQNVADDNGLNLMDGSVVGPGTVLAGAVRDAVFPYIGARNPNPPAVPGPPPPP